MAFEIELKAWVDNVRQTETALHAAAEYLFEYTKEDVYWYATSAPANAAVPAASPAFPSGVRLRRETRTPPPAEAASPAASPAAFPAASPASVPAAFPAGAGGLTGGLHGGLTGGFPGGRAGGLSGGRLLVTFKTKETREGIEVNEEHEFCVNGEPLGGAAEAEFELFLTRAGFSAGFRKTKTGKCWQAEEGGYPVNAELSLVEGLGYFLELEIMLETGSAQDVEPARTALFRFLKRAGIPAERVESRYYSEMLGKR